MRFQETENGGFRKRIGVDQALVYLQCIGFSTYAEWGLQRP